MEERWSVERVFRAAPDSGAEVAGRALAADRVWSETGCEGPLVWGQCRGSAREPYKILVDTARPSYSCTCPSRKHPCKHSLALLFLWAQYNLPSDPESTAGDGSQPARELPPARRTGETPKAVPAQRGAEERGARREAAVHAGMVELDRWLCDQVDAGLAGAETSGYAYFETIAARMIDAQAPGVANWLRSLAGITAEGPHWPARLLAEFARLRLLAQAYLTIGRYPPGLQATIRRHVGFPVAKDEVLRRPAVRDRWLGVGLYEVQDERLTTRRIWLHGLGSRRSAVVLLFAPRGQQFETAWTPGVVLDAELHFYPGQPELRALVGVRHGPAVTGAIAPIERGSGKIDPAQTERIDTPSGVAEVLAGRAQALAADPWLGSWPLVLRGRLERADRGWVLVDRAGEAIAVVGSEGALWRAYAMSAGMEFTFFGELGSTGVNLLSFHDAQFGGGRLVVL